MTDLLELKEDEISLFCIDRLLFLASASFGEESSLARFPLKLIIFNVLWPKHTLFHSLTTTFKNITESVDKDNETMDIRKAL